MEPSSDTRMRHRPDREAETQEEVADVELGRERRSPLETDGSVLAEVARRLPRLEPPERERRLELEPAVGSPFCHWSWPAAMRVGRCSAAARRSRRPRASMRRPGSCRRRDLRASGCRGPRRARSRRAACRTGRRAGRKGARGPQRRTTVGPTPSARCSCPLGIGVLVGAVVEDAAHADPEVAPRIEIDLRTELEASAADLLVAVKVLNVVVARQKIPAERKLRLELLREVVLVRRRGRRRRSAARRQHPARSTPPATATPAGRSRRLRRRAGQRLVEIVDRLVSGPSGPSPCTSG